MLFCVNKFKCVSHSVVCDSLWSRGLQTARLLSPWNSPDKNTGVGSHSLLQGVFPTQGSNPVSCIAGRFFTVWVTREAQCYIRSAFMLRWGLIKWTWHWCKGKKMLSLFGVSKTIWSGIWTGEVPGTVETDSHKVIWHQTTCGMLTPYWRWGSDKFCLVLLSSFSVSFFFCKFPHFSSHRTPLVYQHLQDSLGENQRYANSPDVRHGYSVYFKFEAISGIFKNHL